MLFSHLRYGMNQKNDELRNGHTSWLFTLAPAVMLSLCASASQTLQTKRITTIGKACHGGKLKSPFVKDFPATNVEMLTFKEAIYVLPFVK